MWMNSRYTFTSPAQTDSAEWCAEQTVIALGVFSISVAFGFIYICITEQAQFEGIHEEKTRYLRCAFTH